MMSTLKTAEWECDDVRLAHEEGRSEQFLVIRLEREVREVTKFAVF